MNNDMTYWSACIACLPAEKRAAAERAFREIAEGGENGMWPRLFLLMEAHAAYVHSIPAKITEAGENAAAAVRQAATVNPSLSKEDKEELLKAIQQRNGSQSTGELNAIKSKVGEMAVEMKHLNRQVSQLRYLRVGVAVFLLLSTGLLFYAGYWWIVNRELIQTVEGIRESGLQLRLEHRDNDVRVEIYGPNAGGHVMPGKNGEPIGVAAEFPLK
jgi:hypothetical protein